MIRNYKIEINLIDSFFFKSAFNIIIHDINGNAKCSYFGCAARLWDF